MSVILSCLPYGLSAKDVPGNAANKVKELANPKPPVETPSGTNPAEPANPGENPAKPAEPGDKEQPEEADKDQEDKDSEDAKDKKDKKDKTDTDSKNEKDKPGKGGKSDGPSTPSLPAGIPTSQSAGASMLPVAGGIIGGILSGGKKNEDKKEEKPKPALKDADAAAELALPKAVVSSDTVKSTAAVQASTPAVAAEPLYSEGKGPKIAVIDFEGDYGAQFAQLLAEALKADLKVYSRKELAGKNYNTKAITRVSAKKIAVQAAVDYIVTGKVSKKTETLWIISVFLREGGTGDIKMTDYPRLKSAEDLKPAAESAARKIKERIK